MTRFDENMSLGEARDLLRTLVLVGHECPCCRQFAKVYRRKVNATMARGLIDVYREARTDWCHVRSLRSRSHAGDNREESKLRYWGLLEEETDRRPDGGRSGWWRITDAGQNWVLSRTTIPKYALIYNGKCLALRGDNVGIQDSLGDNFNYHELMGVVAEHEIHKVRQPVEPLPPVPAAEQLALHVAPSHYDI